MGRIFDVWMYENPKRGGSIVSGNLVRIIGEQKMDLGDRVVEQYIYEIEGYKPKNGKPFVSLKANICLI